VYGQEEDQYTIEDGNRFGQVLRREELRTGGKHFEKNK